MAVVKRVIWDKNKILKAADMYVNGGLSLAKVAAFYRTSKYKIGLVLVKCKEYDEELHNKAMEKMHKYDRTPGQIPLDLKAALNNVDRIKKRDLLDWWIKNVNVERMPVCEVVKLAEMSGIKVVR